MVLEAGTGDLADVWKMPPTGPGAAVLPAVARFTRVCAYDRPGTYLPDGRRSRSDPVAMPRSARDIVADLRALLSAADVPGPYVLVGHSFGGMVARLYATRHPGDVAGLVSIDAQNEDFAAAYKDLLTPEQYLSAVLDPQPAPGMESYAAVERLSLETSAAQMRQAQADTPLRRMPVVVVSHSRTCGTRSASRADGRRWSWSARSRGRRTCWQLWCPARATGSPPEVGTTSNSTSQGW